MGIVQLIEREGGERLPQLEAVGLGEHVKLGRDLIAGLEHRQDDVRLYEEYLRAGLVMASGVCGDSRTFITIHHPKIGKGPFVDPIKTIASVGRRKEGFLRSLYRYGGYESTSHRCGESVCGGEAAMLGFYESNSDVLDTPEADVRAIEFKNGLHHHGIPDVTSDWVVDNLLWARNEAAAREFWQKMGGVSGKLMVRIVANLDKFRDECYVGLTAALSAVVKAEWITGARKEGLEWRGVLPAGVVNHHDQTSTPVAVIDIRGEETKAVFANDLTMDNFLEEWPEEGELEFIPQEMIEKMDNEILTRYYAQAREPIDHGQDFSKQGNFWLVVDVLSDKHPIILAGKELLSPGRAFGVSLSGQEELNMDDVDALAQAGYADHLGVKGVVVFAESLAMADKVLFKLREMWAEDLLQKAGFVVAVFNKETRQYDHMVVGKDGEDEPMWLPGHFRDTNG